MLTLLSTSTLVAQTTSVPDPNFEQELIALGLDSDGLINGSMLNAQPDTVTALNVNQKNISDLTGIEAFSQLVELRCQDNQLTSLDLSMLPLLELFDCEQNLLATLDVSACAALRELECSHNQLVTLDASSCPDLTFLDCEVNQLTSLDLTGCTKLEFINCERNQLTALNCSNFTLLEELYCPENQLASLEVSGCNSLYDIICSENQLVSLNVSGLTALEILECQHNQLATVTIAGCTSLSDVDCSNNQLGAINASGCTSLGSLRCGTNQLTSLAIGDCSNLEKLHCNNNQLSVLDASGFGSLRQLHCQNNQLVALDVRGTGFAQTILFDATNNAGLTCILVDDVAQANGVAGLALDVQTSFNTSCPCALSASSTPVNCNGLSDGSAIASATNGIAPYTFNWSNGLLENGVPTSTASNLVTGTYTVTLTDGVGCSATTSTLVSEPSAMNGTLTSTDAGCDPDGSASMATSGGAMPYTYTWNNGSSSQLLSDLAAGTYAVTVSDASGCTIARSETINGDAQGAIQLLPSSCGITVAALNDYIFCQPRAGAERYQFRFTNQSSNAQFEWTVPSSQPTARYTALSFVPSVSYGQSYSVEVRARVAGSWECYGPACTVTTPPSVPTTQLLPAYCNSTLITLNGYMYWSPIPGAERYGIEITGPGAFSAIGYTPSNVPTGTFFSLNSIAGIDYNTAYTVRIRVRIAGVWQAYGPGCTVTTPAVAPTPTINASYCGNTLGSLNEYISFVGVPGATRYQHQVEAAGGASVVGSTFSPFYAPRVTRFSMYFVNGIANSTTYDVSVRAKVNGVWGNYGSACAISTPAAKRSWFGGQVQEGARELLALPNPTNGNSTIVLGANFESATATVRNLMGQVVQVRQVGSANRVELTLDGAPGIYVVTVEGDGALLGQVKLVKQ